MTFEDVKNIYS